MNRDDIIRIAQEIFRKHMKEADQFDPMRIHYSTTQHENAAACVVALAIAEAEREACAKLCMGIADHFNKHKSDIPPQLINPVGSALECAAAIRARGRE